MMYSKFLLSVSPDCGSDGDVSATITVTSDLYVNIVAMCSGEDITDTLGGTTVTTDIEAKYDTPPNAPDGDCYFKVREVDIRE